MGQQTTQDEGRQYLAFISYSHRDKAHAAWLWRQLESYRVPQRLVGTTSRTGVIGRRLTPIFRDRADLPAAQSLRSEIRDALANSANLLVICSSYAAHSQWVNEEILEFKRFHGDDADIFCLLVEGERAKNSLPPALHWKMGLDGELSAEPADPLVADLRPGQDGRRLAKQKLVAGLLGVNLDTLIQRDLQRRLQTVTAVTAAAFTALVAVSWLALEATTARREADARRTDAEGLIEFMLTDLRDKLDEVGRLDVLDTVASRAMDYYEIQDLEALRDDALGRRAQTIHLLGKIDFESGDRAAAQARFEVAFESTRELLRRSPRDADRIYEHAQSAYWLGFSAWKSSDVKLAEEAFLAYRDLAAALASPDIDDPRGTLESAYANTNLGILFLGDYGRADLAANYFQVALDAKLKLARADEANRKLWIDVANGYAWYADAIAAQGDLEGALQQRMAQGEVYRRLSNTDQSDYRLMRRQNGLAVAASRLQIAQGDLEGAATTLRSGAERARLLTKHDPDNADWREHAAVVHLELADCYARLGQIESADLVMTVAGEYIASVLDEEDPSQRHLLRLVFRKQVIAARVALRRNNNNSALAMATEVIEQVRETVAGDQLQSQQMFLLTFAHDIAGQATQHSDAHASRFHWNAIVELWSDGKVFPTPLESRSIQKARKLIPAYSISFMNK